MKMKSQKRKKTSIAPQDSLHFRIKKRLFCVMGCPLQGIYNFKKEIEKQEATI
jgi:hypothetical protein